MNKVDKSRPVRVHGPLNPHLLHLWVGRFDDASTRQTIDVTKRVSEKTQFVRYGITYNALGKDLLDAFSGFSDIAESILSSDDRLKLSSDGVLPRSSLLCSRGIGDQSKLLRILPRFLDLRFAEKMLIKCIGRIRIDRIPAERVPRRSVN